MKFKEIKFGDHIVLKAGEINIIPGKASCVSGESGSGKTSLFKELLKQSQCHVSIDEQEPAFLDGLSLNDHLNLGIQLWGSGLPLDILIEKLDLGDALDQPMSALSGGERKRAAFALCLGIDADMYFLDEPTASLNTEYAPVYGELIERLKEIGKPVLLFTHDKELMKCADLYYEIQDGTLQEKKACAESIDDIHNNRLPNVDTLQKTFFLIKEKQKTFKKAMSLLISLSILLICFFSTYSTVVAKAQKSIMDEVHSDEIIVFKAEPRPENDYDLHRYNKMTGNPWFTEEEIDTISKISHVKEVEWRYDMENLIFFGSVLEDITNEGFDLGKRYAFDINFYLDNTKQGSIHYEESDPSSEYPSVNCYLSNHKAMNSIEKDFGKNGVYLSKDFALHIAKTLGISEDELTGMEIEYSLGVPIFNEYGRGYDATLTIPTYITIVEFDQVCLPIAGILKNSSFGLQDTFDYVIYMERSDMENLIAQHKKDTGKTVYVFNDKWNDYSVDELPQERESELVHVFVDTPWRPTAYSIFPDDPENVPAIIDELKSKGYFVNSEYRLHVSWAAGIHGAKTMYTMAALAFALALAILSLGLAFLSIKQDKQVDAVLSSLGLTVNEIYAQRTRYYILDTTRHIVLYLLAFGFIMILFSRQAKAFILPSFFSIMILFLLTTLCHCFIPILSDQVRRKKDQT